MDQTKKETSPQNNSFIHYLVNSIPYNIFWKDKNSVYLGCNDSFAKTTGIQADLIVGKTDFDMPWKKEEAEAYRRDDQKVMAAGLPILDIEETLRQSNGEELVILTSKVPLKNDKGEVFGILGIYSDITHLKKLEKDLRKAKVEAEEAHQAKSDFLANMSHELRTPLTLILGPIQELLATPSISPDTLHRELTRIQRNSFRLLAMVNDVLDLTKLESSKMDVLWQPTDIEKTVANLVDDTSPLTRAKQIEYVFLTTGNPRLVSIDPSLFEKIVLNLLSNAIKFTPENKKIVVTLNFSESDFRLTVEDTGIGIAPDKIENLFRRFNQMDASIRRRFGGTGIGLALVKEFCTLMNGSVHVTSQFGHGSNFEVRFPISQNKVSALTSPITIEKAKSTRLPELASAPQKPSEPSRSTEAQIRVLIIDDEIDLANFIFESLGTNISGKSITAHIVLNGQDALNALSTFQPHVILCDVMMPEMTGLEFVKHIKSQSEFRQIPVIMLTAKSGRDKMIEYLSAGADDFLPKPFDTGELRARVFAAYRLYNMHLELQAERIETVAAKKADRAKSVFLANISHELRTPMHGILSFAHFGQNKVGKASEQLIKSYFDEIADSGSRLMNLLNDLLDLAKLEANKIIYCLTDNDLNEVALTAARELRAFSEDHGVSIKISQNNNPALATFDSSRILQVLRNLLTNAIKFSEKGSSISVKIDTTPTDVICTISNQGVGIPESELDSIFDKFIQSTRTRSGSGGTGLGLAICKELITQHGGEIWAENHPPETCFIFKIPKSKLKVSTAS